MSRMRNEEPSGSQEITPASSACISSKSFRGKACGAPRFPVRGYFLTSDDAQLLALLVRTSILCVAGCSERCPD